MVRHLQQLEDAYPNWYIETNSRRK